MGLEIFSITAINYLRSLLFSELTFDNKFIPNLVIRSISVEILELCVLSASGNEALIIGIDII